MKNYRKKIYIILVLVLLTVIFGQYRRIGNLKTEVSLLKRETFDIYRNGINTLSHSINVVLVAMNTYEIPPEGDVLVFSKSKYKNLEISRSLGISEHLDISYMYYDRLYSNLSDLSESKNPSSKMKLEEIDKLKQDILYDVNTLIKGYKDMDDRLSKLYKQSDSNLYLEIEKIKKDFNNYLIEKNKRYFE